MNIILCKGKSSYGVLRFFTDEMAAAFEKLGHNAAVVDLLEQDWVDKFAQVLDEFNHCDFIFAFNGIGIDVKFGTAADVRPLYDVINVPYVYALVDDPCQHILRINTKLNHLLVTYTDESHLEFLSNYYPQGHIKMSSVLSMAGTAVRPPNLENPDVYLKTRTIPVLFAGTFIQPERTWTNLPFLNSDIISLLDDIADYILACDCVALKEACNYVLKQRSMELDLEMQRKLYSLLLPYIDEYIRGYCRYRCFKTLAEAEIPIVSCSEGWDNYISNEKYKSVSFIGARQYGELLHDLQKTKIFLNTTTNLVYGASERVFNAMLNGAVIATQANCSTEFVDGQDSILYKWTQLDKLPGKIFHLLENPEVAQQIAKAAREKAEARHTWLHRAEKVLSMVAIYRNLYTLNFK